MDGRAITYIIMKNKHTLAGFTLLTALTLLACITTFTVLSSSLRGEVILSNFIFNMPAGLLIGLINYKIISYLHKYGRRQNLWNIVADILVSCTLTGVPLAVFYRIFYNGQDILQQTIPVILWNSIIVLIIELFLYNNITMENKARLATVEKEKAQYQLEALKSQINPHFLFNSLNVLASLTYQNQDKANRFAKKLSSVYRYLLVTQKMATVPLQDELDFVEAYTYLEQIRFGDTLQIHIKYDKLAVDKQIVPSSIQMLVENALKHNINTEKSPLKISISISKDHVTVTNNLQPRQSTGKSNIGLDNIEKQYRIHGKHIEIMKTEKEFTIKLPLL